MSAVGIPRLQAGEDVKSAQSSKSPGARGRKSRNGNDDDRDRLPDEAAHRSTSERPCATGTVDRSVLTHVR